MSTGPTSARSRRAPTPLRHSYTLPSSKGKREGKTGQSLHEIKGTNATFPGSGVVTRGSAVSRRRKVAASWQRLGGEARAGR